MTIKNPSKRLTSMDIAMRAKVSQATVSRVLNDKGKVDPKTRERVLAVLKETDYAPNIWAQAMKTSRSNAIGIVVSRIKNPLYPEILDSLSNVLTSYGKRMIVWSGEGSGEEAALAGIEQSLVDGVLFTTATENSAALLRSLSLDAPVVLINRTVDLPGCVSVTSDNYCGGELVGNYFLNNGRRKIGLIPGSRAASTLRNREDGFRCAMESAGVTIATPDMPVEKMSHSYGKKAMAYLLNKDRDLDGVFCVNDIAAIGAMDTLIERGLNVPDDIWIVGFDDIYMAGWNTIGLTTVRQPIEAMVSEGVEMLLKRIDGVKEESRILPVELIARRTTSYR